MMCNADFTVLWLQQTAPTFHFAKKLLCQLGEVAADERGQYHLLSACVDFIGAFAERAANTKPTHYAPEVALCCGM